MFRRFKISSSVRPFRLPYSLKWIGPVEPLSLACERIIAFKQFSFNGYCECKWHDGKSPLIIFYTMYLISTTSCSHKWTSYWWILKRFFAINCTLKWQLYVAQNSLRKTIINPPSGPLPNTRFVVSDFAFHELFQWLGFLPKLLPFSSGLLRTTPNKEFQSGGCLCDYCLQPYGTVQ